MTDDPRPFDSDGKAPSENRDADNLFAVALPKNDDSFPVLRAFQSFIDQERERSRRRITMLSTAFIAALVVLMLAFAGFFALFFTHVMSHDEAQQARLFDLVSRAAAPQPAAPAPAAVPAPAAAVPAPQAPAVPANLEELVEKLVAERLRAASPAPSPAPAPAPAPAPEPATTPASADASASSGPSSAPAAPASPPRGILTPAKKTASKPAKPVAGAPAPKGRPATAPQGTAPDPAPRGDGAREAGKSGPRSLSVRPVKALVVPEGYAADHIRVQTQSGASVPMRTLLPVPRAGK